jgi:DNA-binding IclR family transcriptional regulator
MAKSPSIERAVQILDFLTTHAGRGFTLSELSRRLRISKTTAHTILNSLTDRALLVRNPDTNEYRLGPALVPMGAVAERVTPALTHARREAEQLADEFDGECVIVMATGDELLVVGRAGIPGPLSLTFREGQRQPLAPPMGTIILAWMGDRAVEAWLDRLEPDATDSERERYRAAVTAVRRRGYAVGLRVPTLYELHEIYSNADLYTPEGRREISRAFAALARDTYLPADDLPPDAEVGSVAAPVFGPDGSMLFAIALVPSGTHHVRQIPALSRALVRAAGRVTAAIDGQHPGRKEPDAYRRPKTTTFDPPS